MKMLEIEEIFLKTADFFFSNMKKSNDFIILPQIGLI